MVVRTDRRHRTFPSGCFWFHGERGGERDRQQKRRRDETGLIKDKNNQVGKILFNESKKQQRGIQKHAMSVHVASALHFRL